MIKEMSPSFLLASPELVEPVAPWCVVMDNLELGVLMLTQPWLTSGGLRRAELERQLSGLAVELPLGPVYFQRVKRAVARLEQIGVVRGLGTGRGQRFVLEPAGMAALVLNLSVLLRDPTIDGSELELKRALVVMWNLVLDRLGELGRHAVVSEAGERFFDELEALEVLGRRVMSEELVARALDVLQLIKTQRERVSRMLAAARRLLIEAERRADQLGEIDLGRLVSMGHGAAAATLAGSPEAMVMIRTLAAGALPRLGLQATILRYQHYLEYLDGLAAMYASELRTVSISSVRALLARSGA